MKIANVTFQFNGTPTLSLVVAGKTLQQIKKQARVNIKEAYGKRAPKNLTANVIVFGADGAGKSLNKLKKKR